MMMVMRFENLNRNCLDMLTPFLPIYLHSNATVNINFCLAFFHFYQYILTIYLINIFYQYTFTNISALQMPLWILIFVSRASMNRNETSASQVQLQNWFYCNSSQRCKISENRRLSWGKILIWKICKIWNRVATFCNLWSFVFMWSLTLGTIWIEFFFVFWVIRYSSTCFSTIA